MENIKSLIMKSGILLFTIAAAALSSCSAVYRTGQTPDDVYYSPGRAPVAGAEYVAANPQRDGRYQYNDNYNSYDNNYSYEDDVYLRMKVQNPYLWSTFDDYDSYWYYNSYGYSPFAYSFYSTPWSLSYWNSYWYWNSYYNPYYYNVVAVSPKYNPQAYTRVRNFSLNSYTNNSYYTRTAAGRNRIRPVYRNSTNAPNNSNGLGSSFRRLFSSNNNSNSYYTPSSSSSSSGNSRPTRVYTPSSSSSSGSSYRGGGSTGGSSGGSSGGGHVSRPTRGGH